LPYFSSLESLLTTTGLGQDLYHPLWRVLAKRDYGDGTHPGWTY
jgi:hypothetical protein